MKDFLVSFVTFCIKNHIDINFEYKVHPVHDDIIDVSIFLTDMRGIYPLKNVMYGLQRIIDTSDLPQHDKERFNVQKRERGQFIDIRI